MSQHQHPGFEHLWKQDRLADAQILLCIDWPPAQAAEGSSSPSSPSQPTTLQTLPAHTAILSCSPYFDAQLERWQHKRGRDSPGTAAETPKAAATPQIVLTLQHEDHQPAAEAVLHSMYAVHSLQQLLSELPQLQQLHAAVLADMWQLPATSRAAVQLLVQAARPETDTLQMDVFEHFCNMQAYPSCLLPLFKAVVGLVSTVAEERRPSMQRLLLTQLGDLEAVWAEPTQQKLLLGLPLHAMKLLLSCDELQVASEDTVLYTAQKYVNSKAGAMQKLASVTLSRMIRCQHLSLYWLTATALCPTTNGLPILGKLLPQVKQLLSARVGAPCGLSPANLQQCVPDAPTSWSLGKRASKQVSSVEVVWELGVDEIKGAAEHSGRKHQLTHINGPFVTPPQGGLEWGITCECEWDAAAGGSTVGLYMHPDNAVAGSICSWHMTISVAGGPRSSSTIPPVEAGSSMGWHDFFNTGPMAGGWDEAAWAAKGLPTSGKLVITGKIEKVSHCL